MRIRSIKPDFWRDEKIAGLKNRLAGYFFIGLWCVADDEGKFPLNAKALSLQLPIFRSKDVLTYISDLSESGLVVFSECSQWGLIVNWNHQKISHPVAPKINNSDIKWMPRQVNGAIRNIPESSKKTRPDRIGWDRIGKDRIPTVVGRKSKKTQPELLSEEQILSEQSSGEGPAPAAGTAASRCIATYYSLWKNKYGASPPRLGRDHTLLKNISKSNGEFRTIELLHAYFEMPDSLLVLRRHDVFTFFNQLTQVAHFADTGKTVSRAQSNSADRLAANMNLLEELKNE